MTKRRAVAVTRVSSWAELLDELYRESWDETIQRHRSPFVYRGMANAANDLRTSLTRLASRREVARLESHLLRNFRKYARADAAAGDSLWNWLALAAHHGLPTRMIDWTYSPFVALHFATADLSQYDEDAVVWCVDHGETNRRLPRKLRRELDNEGASVFSVDMLNEAAQSLQELQALAKEPFVVFLEPPSLDDRIVTQFALFSLMSNADMPMDTWLEQHGDVSRRVIIPAEMKWEVRDKLDQAGITERMLFPGLDGLTSWLTRYYMPRSEKVLSHEDKAQISEQRSHQRPNNNVAEEVHAENDARDRNAEGGEHQSRKKIGVKETERSRKRKGGNRVARRK